MCRRELKSLSKRSDLGRKKGKKGGFLVFAGPRGRVGETLDRVIKKRNPERQRGEREQFEREEKNIRERRKSHGPEVLLGPAPVISSLRQRA